MKTAIKFKPSKPSDFSKVLKSRVNQYFQDNKISPLANTEMHIKTFILLSFWGLTYYGIVFSGITYPNAYFLWMFMGFIIALVTTNIGHDVIHGAYTHNKTAKFWLEMTFNLNGASAYMWKAMHNIAHHTYTNIHGHDEDISPVPVLRLSPDADHKPIHRFQHIYAFFFYFLGTFTWVFIKDYVKFFQNSVGNYSGKKHPTKEYFFLFFYKFLYYTLFIVLPIYLTPQAWYYTFGGFVLMHLVSGFYLAIVFMLAHAVEQVHFPKPASTGVIENDWFIHQLATTANFATDSKLAAILTGGLNQQVEHHLFPGICSIHYQPLSKIVRQTAEEYHIPYYDNPSFLSALTSHVKFLRKIGNEVHYKHKPSFKPGMNLSVVK